MVAGRRRTTGSILNNLKLKEKMCMTIKDIDQCQSIKSACSVNLAYEEVEKYLFGDFDVYI
jgi:hypothetical protein